MREITGWLFDLYVHPQKGVVLWLVGEDNRPHCFFQDFEITFYAGGAFPRLKELWRFLASKPVKLKKVDDKEDLFDGSQVVMQIQVESPTIYKGLFREVQERFPDLTYYDVDIPLTVRYAAAFNVFMMGSCKVTAEAGGKLLSIQALDKPDDLDPRLPHLRISRLRPDTDPNHASPKYLIVKFGKAHLRLPFSQPRELLNILNSVLSTYDPDVVQTHFGDAWLFTKLEQLSKDTGIPFNPNRDVSMPILKRKEISFFNYGQAHYRSPQVHLRGRWHVDVENCMTYNQYQLYGAIEQTRLSSLPLQEVARRSPGAAIAAMQDLAALRRGVLVPYQSQKGEIPKTYNQLVRADRGGLIFIPKPGIYKNVVVLDFSSMMASIMIRYNVSPETVVDIHEKGDGFEIPELGVKISSRPGMVPETLKPMRDKRLALKRLLRKMRKDDPHRKAVQSRFKMIEDKIKSTVDGIKWLTVVCYGRLGFANSRFGRLNSHEVVSYLSRKVIIKARAIAEAKGFDVLHLYVDSLFVSKPGATSMDFQELAEEIERETQMPMDFDGTIFPWFAFLGTRENPKLGVANRFYGLSPDGDHKIRGIALRRHDTPCFVSTVQMEVLNILTKETDATKLADRLPEVFEMIREQLTLLKNKQVPLEDLVITHTLSREPDKYSVLSATALVAKQLAIHGKNLKRGQQARFIYMAQGPGVFAWDTPTQLDPHRIDVSRYRELSLRAVYEVLQPLGIPESILRDWLVSNASYTARPGVLRSADSVRLALPLFGDLKYLDVERY
jgi:DNA polymerase-2